MQFVDLEELQAKPPQQQNEPEVKKPEKKFREGGLPEPTREGPPEWATIPAGMVFPRGMQVLFIKLLAEWTDTPARGDRVVICWANSIGDERLAASRARNDVNLILGELSKQMIRAIDGHLVDHGGAPGPGNIDAFWMQIGSRCRTVLGQVYNRLHTLNQTQLSYFLENCVEVRSSH